MARARDDEHLRLLRAIGLHSIMILPLLARGRVLGAIALSTAESGRQYGAADLAVAQEVARRAALALDNARLYREAQAAAQRKEESFALLDTLFATAPVGLAFLDRDLRFVRINDFLARASNHTVGECVDRDVRAVFPDLAKDLEHVLETGVPIADGEFSLEAPSDQGARRYWLASMYPVQVSGGKPLGIGVVARDITERRRAEDGQRLLAQASALLDGSLNYETGVDRVAQSAVPRLGGWCFVDVAAADGSARRLTVAQADPKMESVAYDILQRVPPDPTTLPSIPVVLRLEDVAAPSAIANSVLESAYVVYCQGLLRELGQTKGLVIPLRVRGRNYGALVLLSASDTDRYGSGEQALAVDLAQRVAQAIENARLFEHEHKIAETLQQGVLPRRLPEVPGALMAARYVPGRAGLAIGGDWYDVLRLPSGLIGMVMGDVAGRGARAALVMGQLRSALKGFALEDSSPAGVVERLNYLALNLEPRDMASLVYLVIDLEAQTVRFTNAGHPPPLLKSTQGTVAYLETDRSLPLGVMPGARYHEAVRHLGPGSTVLLYTDGLIEYQTAVVDGLKRLADVAASGPQEPDALCHHILGSILTGAPANDDLALLALQGIPFSSKAIGLKFPAIPASLLLFRRTLRRWLREMGVSPAETFQIVAACNEAASNSVEHAYGPRDAGFEVEGRVNGRHVSITIRDAGHWRAPRGAHRGLGLTLMRAVMHRVDVMSGPDGTAVVLERTLREVEDGALRPDSP